MRQQNVVWSIQILRGIAALMVVFHHLRGPAPWLFNPTATWEFGTAGVDIFFVISGFVMFTAARDEAAVDFIRRRIIRVVPLYWIATGLFLVLAYGAMEEQVSGVGIQHILMSLFFVPFANPTYDGAIWPVLVPGWTLNFEMFFYALFGISLLSKRLLPSLTAMIAIGVIAGALLPFDSAVWNTYTSPLLIEFLAGVWLGYAYNRGSFAALKRVLFLGVAGLLVSSAGLAGELKAAVTGASALAIVAGALGFEPALKRPPNEFALLIGNASYSIYLSHMLTLVFVFAVWKRIPITGWVQFGGLIVFGMLACVAVGIAVHVWVEKPVTKLLLGQKRPVAVA